MQEAEEDQGSPPEGGVAALPETKLEADPDGDLLRGVLEEFPRGTRAFADLMARHWWRTWAICQSVLLNEEDAEEATQDVFLKVHRYLPSFRFESRFTTWLQRIARNTSLNLLASRRRERLARARLEQDPLVARLWLPWRAPSPERRRTGLRAALQKLNPEDRMILVMHEIEGLAYEEIAEAFEISAGAARMRALRSRERLRALLTGMWAEVPAGLIKESP